MRKANNPSSVIHQEAWQALKDEADAIQYVLTDDTVYELRLQLRRPGIFALYKADIPAPGLPMLDGFLKYLAFRDAMEKVVDNRPELINELLWQWNAALRGQGWIDFHIPIRQERLSAEVALFDCTVGLPVTEANQILYPAGAFFSQGMDFVPYPSEKDAAVDQIALRRRSVEPLYRPLELSSKFNISSGSTKALDNRIYYTLTHEYAFYFRGDKGGVETLLDFALRSHIGLGKKTSLGYGQLAGFTISDTNHSATLAQPLNIQGLNYLTLLKNIPLSEMRRRCVRKEGNWVPIGLLQPDEWQQNVNLFGVEQLSIASPIETYDRYQPPYWRREGRTQVLRYGTLLMPRQ